MERKKQTITEQIRSELWEGLEKGDLSAYERLLAQYPREKGSFYYALGLVFIEARKKIEEMTKEIGALKKEREELVGSVSGLRRERDVLRNELDSLDLVLSSKKELLRKAQSLEEVGFSPEHLEELYSTVREMEAKRGLSPEEGVRKFLEDLKVYDEKRGFELEVSRLEALKKRLEGEIGEKEEELGRIERRLKSRRRVSEAVDELVETHKLKKEQIIAWSEILWKAGVDVDDLEEEIEKYGDLKRLIKAKGEGLERKENEIKEREATLAELKTEQERVKSSIKALTEAGVEEIKRLGEEIRRWGEIKEEAGKLEREIKLGRYFLYASGEPHLAGEVPLPALFSFLEILEGWCRAKNLDPEVEAGERISKGYYGYPSSYSKMKLLDLIRWVRKGFEEVR
jgi:uncharacterized coiled-coil DUF342 family protein